MATFVIFWNCLILTNFNVLGIFPTQFLSLNLILSAEFQNSNCPEIFPEIFRKSGSSQEIAVWGQFQHIGYHFHSILVTEIDFEVRISKFIYFWNLSRNFVEIWKFSRICSFGPIPTYWVSFPLNFSHWNGFWAQNFKIPVFQKFQKFSGNLEILWNLLFWANCNILGMISPHFWSLISILKSEFQNKESVKFFVPTALILQFVY